MILELICKNAAGFSAPKLKKTETVGPKRCSAAKSAILQTLWDRKIDQNGRFVGSPNPKSFSGRQTRNLDEKGKSQGEIQREFCHRWWDCAVFQY
jgi:hypothetical protein